MAWRAPARSLDDRARSQGEKEDMNYAMEVLLIESSRRPTGDRWRTGTDEDHAKTLQDRSHSSLCPPSRGYGMSSHIKICGGCNQEILYGYSLRVRHTCFHPSCFRCHSCRYPINESEFILSEKHPYHRSCFKELTHPKCDVCHQYVALDATGSIEYMCHPYWKQKYCPSHEYDNTARCCSCERLKSRGERYFQLEDGRMLCFECMESAMTDTGECQPLYHAVRDFFEGMNMRIDQQIPMFLVEREALNEVIVGEKNDQGYHHLPEARSSCLLEEQTVTSVHRRPKIRGHQFTGMRTQAQKLTRKCEVTAILVLYGLPRLLTGSILAHELMRAWLRLKGYRNLDPEVEEGICRILSYMWLESEVKPSFAGEKSTVENKLGECFKNQIANESSPACGGGFRAANEAVNKYGLRCILEHIRLTGFLPQ